MYAQASHDVQVSQQAHANQLGEITKHFEQRIAAVEQELESVKEQVCTLHMQILFYLVRIYNTESQKSLTHQFLQMKIQVRVGFSMHIYHDLYVANKERFNFEIIIYANYYVCEGRGLFIKVSPACNNTHVGNILMKQTNSSV